MTSTEPEIKVSRVMQRKKTHILLGVYAVVDGRRVGTSVPCPPNITGKDIKETLDNGERSLREVIAKHLAQKALSRQP